MKPWLGHLLVALGATVGGIIGHVACVWIAHQGYYAMVLPGGLVGLGASVARSRFRYVPIMALCCALWALYVSLITEWHLEVPSPVDPSFGYFLAHITTLPPITMIMMAAGTLIAFWIPFSRGLEGRPSRPQHNPQPPQNPLT